MSEHGVAVVHFTCSAVFLAALTATSFLFGYRESRRTRREGQRLSPAFWGRYHYACAGAMVLALVWIVVTLSVHWPDRALLIGEWVSAWAFAASWLMKGLELDMLRKKVAKPVEAGAAIPVA